MSTRMAWLGALVRRTRADDAGYSLMEVMVGSAVMSVVMAVATGGFVSMYQTTDLAESAALTQTSLTASFNKLDREVRYAYRVNDEYVTGGSFAVDYVVPDADNAMQCVQLTLPRAGGSLVRRQWPQASTSADASATVGTIATDMAPAGTDSAGNPVNPFHRLAIGTDDSNFDRLNITVNSTVGRSQFNSSRTYDLTFTALNTVKPIPADPSTELACTKG